MSDVGIMSPDGRYVLIRSFADNLVAGDMNGRPDVFVRDRGTGTTECVSVDPTGAPGNGDSGGWPDLTSISADGRFVAFVSAATNLVAGRTTKGVQVFVRDRLAGTTELVSFDSAGVQGNGDSDWPSLSADGRFVAFESFASNLVPGDTNGSYDIFVRDRVSGTTERVSVDSSGKQTGGGNFPMISMDGRCVVFSSGAADLVPGDTNRKEDGFLHDRTTGMTERVSVDSSGLEGNGDSEAISLSLDGHCVVLQSLASNLVSSDLNGKWDVFIRDRTIGVTERISVDSTGGEANGASYGSLTSGDGNLISFISDATNLVSGDTNGVTDGFVHNRSIGLTSRWSIDSAGNEGNDDCLGMTISADGKAASLLSRATNLVPGDTNGFTDVFVRDERVASWLIYGSGFPGTNGVPSFTSNAKPVIGTTITLDLENSYQQPTVGLLFAGTQRANFHSSWGGDLLLAPILTVPITFSYSGDQFDWSIPLDTTLLGVVIDLQAIEADPGAAKGVSFTPGLELAVGF